MMINSLLIIDSFLMTGLLSIIGLRLNGLLKPTSEEANWAAWGLTLLVALAAAISVLGRMSPEFVLRTSLWALHNALSPWIWIFAFLMTNLSFTTAKRVRWFHCMAGGSLLGIALLTTMLHASGIKLINYSQVYSFQGYYRPHGILFTPLEAGLVALLSWAWGLGWGVQQGWRRVAGLLLTGLSTAVVYLTFSRSAWLGLSVALLVGFLFARYQKALWVPLWVTLATFLLCSVGLPLGWQRGVYAAQGDPSVQNRLELWMQMPSHLIRYPFGITEVYSDTIEEYMAAGSTVNFYLDIGVQYGILPLVLLLGIVSVLGWRVMKCGKHGMPVGLWGLGVIATVVCLVFMNPIADSLAMALLGGFWGMVSAMEVKPHEPPRLHPD